MLLGSAVSGVSVGLATVMEELSTGVLGGVGCVGCVGHLGCVGCVGHLGCVVCCVLCMQENCTHCSAVNVCRVHVVVLCCMCVYVYMSMGQ